MSQYHARLSPYQQRQALELRRKHVPIRTVAQLLECDKNQILRLEQRYRQQEQNQKKEPIPFSLPTDDIWQRLRGLPFFCFHTETCNGERCFWDNFPVFRHGKQMRLLKYEQDIVSKFEQSPYHIIMKPVSAGITTLCLYWLVWMATKDDDWKGRSVGLICGPNLSLAGDVRRE